MYLYVCNIKLKIKYTVYVKLTNSIILLVNIYDNKGDDFNFFANTSFIESKLQFIKIHYRRYGNNKTSHI